MSKYEEKIRTCIDQIKINGSTYSNFDFEPTLVNLFYGKNGSGKSTLAKIIRYNPSALRWKTQELDVMLFDRDYVSRNIEDGLKGVFTLTEEDAKDKKKLEEQKRSKETFEANREKLKEENVKLTSEDPQTEKGNTSLNSIPQIEKRYYNSVRAKFNEWQSTYFPLVKAPRANKDLFKLLSEVTPVQANINDLYSRYTKIYAAKKEEYSYYKHIDHSIITTSKILKTPIVTEKNLSDFAKFVTALDNLQWLEEGFRQYSHSAGDKCPFCQRSGMDWILFKKNLLSCYGERYEEDFTTLQTFSDEYKRACNNILNVLKANRLNTFHAEIDMICSYQESLDAIESVILQNFQLLDLKIKSPSIVLEDFVDIRQSLLSISDIISKINISIKEHIYLASASEAKEEIYNDIMSFMAHECHSLIIGCRVEVDSLRKKVAENNTEISRLDSEISKCEAEIARLSKRTVNTIEAMDRINETLANIGFKGFRLRASHDDPYSYEIVRENNTRAEKSLSEGERNFIAFLHFYHSVMRSLSKDGQISDKVVVIDDPVSSLDHQTILYVANLVRDLMDQCIDNYELHEKNEKKNSHIKQFFCLTHNPVFFREIAYDRTDQYECVNFFEIIKDDKNCSSIKESSDKIEGKRLNINPAQSYYDSIWHEFRTTKSKKSLMNSARQILYYFFVRNNGYDAIELKKMLLEGENRKIFERKNSYYIAVSMLDMLNIRETRLNDGLFFDDSQYSLAFMRAAFKEIFKLMNHEQYYNFRMGLV